MNPYGNDIEPSHEESQAIQRWLESRRRVVEITMPETKEEHQLRMMKAAKDLKKLVEDYVGQHDPYLGLLSQSST